MTNLIQLGDLFRAARKQAAACAFATAIAAVAAGQTNTFPASGNVGIGTTTPTAPLEVKAATSSHSSVLLNTTSTGYAGSFVFQEAGSTKASIQHNPGVLPAGLLFNTNGGSSPANTSMVISGLGNVGIGTTNPNARFIVASGNFGLGTNNLAPWTAQTSVIESLDSSIFFGIDTDIGLNSNAYHNAGWKYKTADPAANIHLYKGDIYFRTAGAGTADAPVTWAESMFIKSNGNVGIGTSSPATRFHVKSTTATVSPRFESTFGHAILELLDKDDTMYSYMNFGSASGRGWQLGKSANGGVGPDGGFYFYELTTGSGGARLAISKGGNVGIGTTSPGQRLSVAGTVESTSGGFKFPDGTIQATAASGSSQWSGTGPIYYTGGNVGIGTTNPSAKLELAPNSAIKLGNAYFSSGGDYVHLSNNEWYNGTSWTANAPGALIQISGQDVNFYRHDAAGAHTQSMNINSSGKVGIGTISPVYSLDVNGGVNGFRAKAATSSSSDAIATFENSSGIQAIVRGNGYIGIGTTAPGVKLDVNGYIAAGSLNGFVFTDDLNTGLTSSAPDKLNLVTGGTTRLHVDNAGNVGIGKTDPQYKLDVVGDIKASGTIHAKYQDLAEWVPSSEQLAAGTVVVLDTAKSNQVISSTQSYDTRVAGVISAQPGIALGESGEGKVLVATTGRVRVKVDASRGPIQIGDLLVTSDVPGVAMKSEPIEFGGRKMHMPGTIIGKALEPLAKGRSEILVLLSLQ